MHHRNRPYVLCWWWVYSPRGVAAATTLPFLSFWRMEQHNNTQNATAVADTRLYITYIFIHNVYTRYSVDTIRAMTSRRRRRRVTTMMIHPSSLSGWATATPPPRQHRTARRRVKCNNLQIRLKHRTLLFNSSTLCTSMYTYYMMLGNSIVRGAVCDALFMFWLKVKRDLGVWQNAIISDKLLRAHPGWKQSMVKIRQRRTFKMSPLKALMVYIGKYFFNY